MSKEPIDMAFPTSRIDAPGHGFIRLDTPCDVCAGVGIVQNPLWAMYFEKWADSGIGQIAHTPPVWKGRSYCAALGITPRHPCPHCDPEWTFMQANPEPADPEENECGECDGVGMVPTAAGLSLLAMVDRYRRGAS